jgi:hypothetical protein
MNIHDFAWHDSEYVSVKPMRPVLSYAIKDRVPREGQIKFKVKAAITSLHHGVTSVPRNFTCSVSVQADERDAGERWRETLRAMLIQECLARWQE